MNIRNIKQKTIYNTYVNIQQPVCGDMRLFWMIIIILIGCDTWPIATSYPNFRFVKRTRINIIYVIVQIINVKFEYVWHVNGWRVLNSSPHGSEEINKITRFTSNLSRVHRNGFYRLCTWLVKRIPRYVYFSVSTRQQ